MITARRNKEEENLTRKIEALVAKRREVRERKRKENKELVARTKNRNRMEMEVDRMVRKCNPL